MPEVARRSKLTYAIDLGQAEPAPLARPSSSSALSCSSPQPASSRRSATFPMSTSTPRRVLRRPPDPRAPSTVASDLAGLTGRLAVLNAEEPRHPGSRRFGRGGARRDRGRPEPGPAADLSPDGSRVAWVHVEVTDDETLEAVLATSTDAGGRATEATTRAVVPFYLSWDPTSSRIAYLGGREADIEIGIVEDERGRSDPLDTGQPYYLSWAPEGDEMLVHVGEDGSSGSSSRHAHHGRRPTGNVLRAGVDGRRTELRLRVGHRAGPAPRRARRRRSERQSARAVRRAGPVRREPRRPQDRVPDPRAAERAAAHGHRRSVRRDDRDRRGPHQRVFWSPNGERLLYLVPDPDEDRFWYRWGVWDGTSCSTPRFLLSLLVVEEYLPFFEQYAQSMSLWSPDARAFASPRAERGGRAGDLGPVRRTRPRAGARRGRNVRGLVTGLTPRLSSTAPPCKHPRWTVVEEGWRWSRE